MGAAQDQRPPRLLTADEGHRTTGVVGTSSLRLIRVMDNPDSFFLFLGYVLALIAGALIATAVWMGALRR